MISRFEIRHHPRLRRVLGRIALRQQAKLCRKNVSQRDARLLDDKVRDQRHYDQQHHHHQDHKPILGGILIDPWIQNLPKRKASKEHVAAYRIRGGRVRGNGTIVKGAF
ncbi:hypothetical protein ACVDG5_020995 [Mesorhizobium sp. ORM6]